MVDAPLETENIIVEVPQDDGPFGARWSGRASDGADRTRNCKRGI